MAVIQETYIQGISTRSVADLVRSMGMDGLSKSQVGERLPGPADQGRLALSLIGEDGKKVHYHL